MVLAFYAPVKIQNMPESKSKPGMEFNKVQREVLRSGSKPEFRQGLV